MGGWFVEGLGGGDAQCGCDSAGMREVSQLIDVEGPAWSELGEMLGASPVSIGVLPVAWLV